LLSVELSCIVFHYLEFTHTTICDSPRFAHRK
jgi:hypothetical protein